MLPLFDDAGPVSRSRAAVVLIIWVNVVCFLYELGLGPNVERLMYGYGMIPAHITGGGGSVDPAWLTLITSQFLHGGWMHLGSNMLFLWIFGDEVEGAIGSFGFLLFYLTGGCVAGLVQAYMAPASGIPTVGASGAVAAVLGAYIVRFPRARVMTLVSFFFLYLPAWLVLGLWGLGQAFQGVAAVEGAGRVADHIAVWAHVGGFFFGMLTSFGHRNTVSQPEANGAPLNDYPFYSSRRPW